MKDAPDNHGPDRRITALEERMNTRRAEYRTDIARLAEDMAKRESAQTDRIAMVTDRMASSRWWRTAILSGTRVAPRAW